MTLMVATALSACSAGNSLVRQSDLLQLQQQLAQHEQRFVQLAEEHNAMQESLERLHTTQSELLTYVREAREEQQAEIRRREALRAAAARRAAAEEAARQRNNGTPVQDSLAIEEAGARSEVNTVNGKVIVGGVESVYLSPPGVVLPARIDTGATSASLDARDIHPFERDGENWVRFHLVHPETGQPIPLELKVSRYVRVLQANQSEGERRPVVELLLTLGDVTQTAEFTLSERSHLEYPVLIGRNVLRDLMVVDVSRSHTLRPAIPEPTSSSQLDLLTQ